MSGRVRVAPWIGEIVVNFPSLVRSYVPGAPIDPRTRERVILAVTEVNGCRYSAWIHGAWQEFLGDELRHGEAEQVLESYAIACAEAGRPLPTDQLSAVLPGEAVRAVRATVAQVEISNLVGNSADRLLGRLTGRRRPAPLAFVREAVTVAAALPVAVPLFAAAGAMRLTSRIAPLLPSVDTPEEDDANLLAHLLATATPAYLSNAFVRLGLLALPRPVAIGVRSGRTSATLRIGRRRISVENGIARDTVVVVEGDAEPLLQLATGSIVRELTNIRIRPS